MNAVQVTAADRIKVVSVLSVGHSGSTLLDLMLGSHSRVEGLGEICTFDDYFSPESILPWSERGCTCRTHVEQCPYWKEVRARLDRGRPTPFRLPGREGDDFAASNRALFEAVLTVSGKRIVCDSSKDARRTQSLLRDRRLDCTVIHLVRDGRAVAYSYKRLGFAGHWHNYYQALRGWARLNALFAETVGEHPGTLLVRYEDLVLNPRRELTRILDRLGLDFEEPQMRFWEQTHHNLCGNRMRMAPVQEIRKDDEYRAALSAREWYAGTVLVLGSLRRYGYPLFRGTTARAPSPSPVSG